MRTQPSQHRPAVRGTCHHGCHRLARQPWPCARGHRCTAGSLGPKVVVEMRPSSPTHRDACTPPSYRFPKPCMPDALHIVDTRQRLHPPPRAQSRVRASRGVFATTPILSSVISVPVSSASPPMHRRTRVWDIRPVWGCEAGRRLQIPHGFVSGLRRSPTSVTEACHALHRGLG